MTDFEIKNNLHGATVNADCIMQLMMQSFDRLHQTTPIGCIRFYDGNYSLQQTGL